MPSFVDILCKNQCNSMCIISGYFCGLSISHKKRVEKPTFSHTFPYLFTHFSTVFSNLFLINVFHFSTKLTTITTNNIK